MASKKKVFISSTYKDLVGERKAVEETIIRAGDFPVGMEAFPAADEEQLEFIKSLIDECDFYVLIIAGKYGSLSEDGRSYTEAEFDYAVSTGVPILVMLRDELSSLSLDKSEDNEQNRNLLAAFIEKASTNRLHKKWTTIDGLKLSVRETLDHSKATKKRPGWVRGGHQASNDVLERVIALQNQNAELTEQIHQLKNAAASSLPDALNLSDFSRAVEVYVSWRPARSATGLRWHVVTTDLGEIFNAFAADTFSPTSEGEVQTRIAKYLLVRTGKFEDERGTAGLDPEFFNRIKVHFYGISLIEFDAGGRWKLTESGKRQAMERLSFTDQEQAPQ